MSTRKLTLIRLLFTEPHGFRKGMGPLIRTHGSGSELRSFLLVAHVVDVYGLLMMSAKS